MAFITVRLDEKLMEIVAQQAQALHLSKSDYIRRAIEEINRQMEAQEIRQSLMRASLECRAESVRINKEFSNIEGDENFDSTV